MIQNQEILPGGDQAWHQMEKYHYSSVGARHPSSSNRSSFCSTCSSYDSEYSEEEDSLSRWPWIPYIQNDGSLFFLEPYFEPQKNEEKKNGEQDAFSTKANSIKKKEDTGRIFRGFGRIKGALKRNTTFGKKDKEKDSMTDGIIGSEKNFSENNNKNVDFLLGDSYEIQLMRKMTVLNIVKNSVELEENSNLLEDFLGVISGLDLDPISPVIGANGSTVSRGINAVTIQGLVTKGPANSNEDIGIGDTLLAINGVEVTQRNVNSVLSKVRWPSEVVLTIEKEVQIPIKPKVKSKIIDLVTGAIGDVSELAAYQEICAVMYLTLDSNEDDPDWDIIFWYPDSPKAGKLKTIRGMFLTISDLMKSVTGTEAESSTLLIQEQVIHVCYQKFGGNVLVIAAPDHKTSLLRLEQSVLELKTQMDFLYESSEKAFHSDNQEDVHHLFVLFMEKLLRGLPVKSQSEISNRTEDCFSGIRYLRLCSDKHVWVSNAISDAEAADYGECADDFFPHRRLYTILGSCLFYKGNLVCNHLPENDLLNCIIFCKHHCLFTLIEEQRVSQLVVWKEVYPSSRKDYQNERNCFEEPTGRCFLLVVGQKHSLLGMLLEAGGAASTPEVNPGPHPYYVDTAFSILAYIQEALDFETICEAKLRGTSIPAITSINNGSTPRQNQHPISPLEFTLRKLPAHLESSVGMRHSQSMESIRTLTRGEESPRQGKQSSVSSPYFNRKSESKASDDSGSNSSSMKLSVSNCSAASTPLRNVALTNGDNTSSISTKLTAGVQNTLFYYTSCDKAKGILLCPPSSCSDAINNDILDNFYKACDLIRRTFISNNESRSNGKKEKNDSTRSNRVYEQGLLFKTKLKKGSDLKKSQNFLEYWVIGRQLDDFSREFYVCFHDGTPQSAIELAFRFGFGTVT